MSGTIPPDISEFATTPRRRTVEIALDLIKELATDDTMMWVVGGGPVVSENDSKGIKEPEYHNGSLTVEADNWHFHVMIDDVTGIQFVESESHGDLLTYYVRFSGDNEATLLRGYFPNPYLDDEFNKTELQPERLKAFTVMREKYVGRDGVIFVRRTPPTHG
jgi:hypothetical protein